MVDKPICRRSCVHWPLIRCVQLRVVHAPGMPGTFSPPPRVSDPDMHHGTCVTHVSWCVPGSLTSGFLWSRWRGKRSLHFQRMRNPEFYVSGKRPFVECVKTWKLILLRLSQLIPHSALDIFRSIFFHENLCIMIRIHHRYLCKGSVESKSASFLIVALAEKAQTH